MLNDPLANQLLCLLLDKYCTRELMFLNLFALFSKITDGVGLDFYLGYNSLSLLLVAFLPPPFAASLWSPPLISAFPSSTFHCLMLSLSRPRLPHDHVTLLLPASSSHLGNPSLPSVWLRWIQSLSEQINLAKLMTLSVGINFVWVFESARIRLKCFIIRRTT